MGTKRWLPVILAMVMSLWIISPVAAQRPDPHSWEKGTPAATAVVAGCELVEPYVNALYSTLDDSGAFADFFYADVDFGDVSAEQADEIITDGNAMIADLTVLEVPASYAEAHENILLYLQVDIDTARFYGIDTSVVPDLAAQASALATVSEGERALATACPEEVEAVGGYILVNPAELESPVDPETIPE